MRNSLTLFMVLASRLKHHKAPNRKQESTLINRRSFFLKKTRSQSAFILPYFFIAGFFQLSYKSGVRSATVLKCCEQSNTWIQEVSSQPAGTLTRSQRLHAVIGRDCHTVDCPTVSLFPACSDKKDWGRQAIRCHLVSSHITSIRRQKQCWQSQNIEEKIKMCVH